MSLLHRLRQYKYLQISSCVYSPLTPKSQWEVMVTFLLSFYRTLMDIQILPTPSL